VKALAGPAAYLLGVSGRGAAVLLDIAEYESSLSALSSPRTFALPKLSLSVARAWITQRQRRPSSSG
jgi:hypothetical protein